MGDLGNEDRLDQYWSLDDLRRELEARWTLTDTPERTGGPARYVRVAETGGRIGFITPLTHNFCESCNRVRLTCTGQLFMCLGQEGRRRPARRAARPPGRRRPARPGGDRGAPSPASPRATTSTIRARPSRPGLAPHEPHRRLSSAGAGLRAGERGRLGDQPLGIDPRRGIVRRRLHRRAAELGLGVQAAQQQKDDLALHAGASSATTLTLVALWRPFRGCSAAGAVQMKGLGSALWCSR